MVIGYLDFGGQIKGNSSDAKHPDWIEIYSVFQAVNRNVDPIIKPADALSKSLMQVGGIEVGKNADESSPVLIAAFCEGKCFPKVTIDLVRTGKKGTERFYQVALTNAYLSNYGFDVKGSQITTEETLTFFYSQIKWSYSKVDRAGKPSGTVEAGWDLNRNEPA